METRKTRLALTAGSLALALALAGCGGGGNSSGPAAASSSGGSGSPPPDDTPMPTNLVELPDTHGITAALVARAKASELFDSDTIMIDAGMSQKVGGVRFFCPDGSDCTITVNAGVTADLTTVTYDEAGGMPMAVALDDTGNTAFENLAKVLAEDGTDDTARLADLMSNIYDDTPDVPDDLSTDIDESVNNGGGVTSSLTTHNQPGMIGDADPLTGISDLFVTVAATGVPEAYASKKLSVIAQTGDTRVADADATPPVTAIEEGDVFEKEISRVVMVDENGDLTNGHTAKFVATADWHYNPAQNWEATREGGMPDMGFWTYVIDAMEPGQDLAGGRTLRLDMRSDFDPNNMMKGDDLVIARGPGDDERDRETGESKQGQADWNMIVLFDNTSIAAALDSDGNVEFGREVAFPEDGVKGSYMGVKGVFKCADVDGNNECLINHHENGKLGVSGEDNLIFTPYVYTPDDDWITAGAWLTIPDDQEQGDYALGAFVYGIDPYKPSEDAARGLMGTASYKGQAFGGYAEVDGAHTEVGSFTATAMLTADFDTEASSTGNNFGTIQGNLTDFMAEDQEEGWDVYFGSAVLKMAEDDDGVVTPESALRFNAGATGHARGHGMVGYWNGQFYNSGDNAVTFMVPNPQSEGAMLSRTHPGSAAGTFGLTTERDNEDSYSLTLGGAFVTHHGERKASAD